jgi:hypothetical protein
MKRKNRGKFLNVKKMLMFFMQINLFFPRLYNDSSLFENAASNVKKNKKY